jgi:hypothetical protein
MWRKEMRLIDADEVINILKETGIIQDNDLGQCVIDEINRIPTAYDVDKVVEELENRVLDTTDSLTGIGAKWAYKGAINIVKVGGTND